MSIDLVQGGLAPWQARRVAAHIAQHLHQRIRTTELAQLASLSDSHFSRAFSRTFGAPPGGYIAARRMERAQAQMLQSTDTLASIALGCGLADQAHFTRMFRKFVGMTPGAWRRQNAAGPTSHSSVRARQWAPDIERADIGA